jgi:hypothetical protein
MDKSGKIFSDHVLEFRRQGINRIIKSENGGKER